MSMRLYDIISQDDIHSMISMDREIDIRVVMQSVLSYRLERDILCRHEEEKRGVLRDILIESVSVYAYRITRDMKDTDKVYTSIHILYTIIVQSFIHQYDIYSSIRYMKDTINTYSYDDVPYRCHILDLEDVRYLSHYIVYNMYSLYDVYYRLFSPHLQAHLSFVSSHSHSFPLTLDIEYSTQVDPSEVPIISHLYQSEGTDDLDDVDIDELMKGT